jgi:hypothetical protein
MRPEKIVTRTEEIPKKRWPKYFDEFSRRYEGWLINIEELLRDRGAQKEASELPFHGATAVLKPRPSVTIEVGRKANHIEHRVDSPEKIWIESLAGGAVMALNIESAGGRKTLLSFRSPMPVEMVDGIAAPLTSRKT